MAAAEARACGVPVIVPDRGGAADHGRGGAGMVYKAGNAQAASQAIVELVTGRIGLAGEIDPPVTMDEHFARLFAAYEGLAGSARRAA